MIPIAAHISSSRENTSPKLFQFCVFQISLQIGIPLSFQSSFEISKCRKQNLLALSIHVVFGSRRQHHAALSMLHQQRRPQQKIPRREPHCLLDSESHQHQLRKSSLRLSDKQQSRQLHRGLEVGSHDE